MGTVASRRMDCRLGLWDVMERSKRLRMCCSTSGRWRVRSMEHDSSEYMASKSQICADGD